MRKVIEVFKKYFSLLKYNFSIINNNNSKRLVTISKIASLSTPTPAALVTLSTLSTRQLGNIYLAKPERPEGNEKYIIPATEVFCRFPDDKGELYGSITKYKSTNTLRLHILIKHCPLGKLTPEADRPYTSRTDKSTALKIYGIAIGSIIEFHKSAKVLYNLEVDIYAPTISTIKTTKATEKAASASTRKAKADLIATKAAKTKAIKGPALIPIP
ncbi:uncharacterized protein RSE6_14342 [Rhynchosporium secalis]|uniref:Uncharacterized protein n=1 Tax=Rhynchosporium secalis TaxID=38038 RepID=A0A1E1MV32_RHYSE|nr:uncharacterized protein RSE6_14342 [Rhynchosporium secalis]